jgi:hypothetical protein
MHTSQQNYSQQKQNATKGSVFVALLEQGLTANALLVSIDALSVTLITELRLQWQTAGRN